MQDIVDLRLILFGEDLKDIGREHVRDYYMKILNKNKAIFPINSRSWINELKNYEYAVGTRLHGTIAALNARIPATLIIHDSRTQEIADYHKIPSISINHINNKTSVENIVENSNWNEFNQTSKTNYNKLIKFF
ncbi:polysaccharide pyruvyl transferase family protein [Methanobrevibacter arboriphilus]|nr:polysaccharide pyruvyl transferase family protein [Methanobrevibacter arboriphilus]